VVKTLILEDEERQPLIVLMHGDRAVSLRQLARVIGRKSVEMCEPRTAQRHSGYLVGGTSPFGTRQRMPVYVERSVLAPIPVDVAMPA
jgi:Cys-tRNA(Pro) deacylase